MKLSSLKWTRHPFDRRSTMASFAVSDCLQCAIRRTGYDDYHARIYERGAFLKGKRRQKVFKNSGDAEMIQKWINAVRVEQAA